MSAPESTYQATQQFRADLGGTSEVNGQARFTWSQQTLRYWLEVNRLSNITSSRLRQGSSDGPVVAYLYGPASPRRLRSLEASGILRAHDLIGPLKGRSPAALVAEMAAGRIWVDVATSEQPYGAVDGRVYRTTR